MFNIKALAITAIIGATALIAPSAEARMQQNKTVGGYEGVTIIERSSSRHSVDTLLIPFTEGVAKVNVVCASGDYEWTQPLNNAAAREIVGAWCNY